MNARETTRVRVWPRSAPHRLDRLLWQAALLLLAGLSGAAGLIYEVVWSRRLGLFLGTQAAAQAIVVIAYMLGLALGAWWIGRLSDRRRKGRLYATLEAVLAGFGLLSLPVASVLETTFAGFGPLVPPGSMLDTPLRLLGALVLLLVPATAIGGTLPTLAAWLRSNGLAFGPSLARVGAAHTVGAALGAWTSGFVLLPALGLTQTVWLACALNLAVALGVLWLSRGEAPPHPRSEPATDSEDARRGSEVNGAKWLLFATGATGAVCQFAWLRGLHLVIGSSVLALATTLTLFLLFWGFGQAALGFGLRRRAWQSRWLVVVLLALSSIAILGSSLALARAPRLFLGLASSHGTAVASLAVGLWILVAPTLLQGALFPAIANGLQTAPQSTGRDAGVASQWNALGSAAGVALAAFLLLPLSGLHNTLLLAGLVPLLALCWFGILLFNTPPRPALLLLVVPLVVTLGFGLIPKDPALLTLAPAANFTRFVEADATPREWIAERSELLFTREGREAVVSVRDDGDERLLVINGKTDGSRLGDRRTQVLLAHLPMWFRSSPPSSALSIGLGTGITTGALADYDELESIRVVEISPGVVAASSFFDAESGDVLLDPRVELVIADARRVLLADRDSYDLIVSEPSNPWISGVANLFTQEFFELAQGRLGPGGILAQWFHLYGMDFRDVQSILHTFQSVFPEVVVFQTQRGDLVLLGSREPLGLDLHKLESTLRAPEHRRQLAAAGVGSIEDVVSAFLLPAGAVAKVAGEHPVANTDDRPRLEWNAARSLGRASTTENLVGLVTALGEGWMELPVQPASAGHELMGLALTPAEVEELPKLRPKLEVSRFVVRDGEQARVLLRSQRSLELGGSSSAAPQVRIRRSVHDPDSSPASTARATGSPPQPTQSETGWTSVWLCREQGPLAERWIRFEASASSDRSRDDVARALSGVRCSGTARPAPPP